MRFLATTALAILVGACSVAPPPPPAELAIPIQPAPFPQGSAQTETAAALDRISRLNPILQAVIATDPTALEQARRIDETNLKGPLAGKPVLIKDNIEERQASGGSRHRAGDLDIVLDEDRLADQRAGQSRNFDSSHMLDRRRVDSQHRIQLRIDSADPFQCHSGR